VKFSDFPKPNPEQFSDFGTFCFCSGEKKAVPESDMPLFCHALSPAFAIVPDKSRN